MLGPIPKTRQAPTTDPIALVYHLKIYCINIVTRLKGKRFEVFVRFMNFNIIKHKLNKIT